MGDAQYISDHFPRSKWSIATGWRPKIKPNLREKQPELVALIEECWVEDPMDRPEFVEIEPRLATLKPLDGDKIPLST